ncbi:uncharacterized protein LOC129766291 [Toxorhynchites rutilus septentrionalis]|uniref:uncharacterized protein LOC129766291 n=1 Tax=Toxorhynchites rutilus septentrionalis TaxID=329112 RepID=UPI00247A72B4|nr:uncharacterized protein LOC129766291 [Toxorhynchites rutilus septentrionalis]
MMEEQKAMRMRRILEEEAARAATRKKLAVEEEEFLKKKYEILLAETEDSEDGASRRSRLSSRASRERVQSWLSNQEVGTTHKVEVVPSSSIMPTVVVSEAAQQSIVPVPATSSPIVSNIPVSATSVPASTSTPISMDVSRSVECADGTIVPQVQTPVMSRQHIETTPRSQRRLILNSVGEVPGLTNVSMPPTSSVTFPQFGTQQQSVTPVRNGPSNEQMAARQVMPRELPNFSGDPQDWPLFYSSFCNSTEACGYTDSENLARLQRCIKDSALEAVRSRLLMPQSVPFVIDILRRLYGRPEILIHSLLQKLRTVPSPKFDNLQSQINFGLAVQNVVDHMTIANLPDHLWNPTLLHELVEKLPPQIKMQWSYYKSRFSCVNLTTFSAFMSELVMMASDVTLPMDALALNSKTGKSIKEKPKLYMHTEDQREKNSEFAEKMKTPMEQAKKLCVYCGKERHEIANCIQFKALDVDVTIHGNGKHVSTYAFLDDGSNSTLLENKIASALGIKGPTDGFCLSWTGNISREEKESQRISIVICGDGKKFKLHNVRTVQQLQLPAQTMRYEDLVQTYHHLKGLPVRSYEGAIPGIIIGIEHIRLLTALRTREGKDNEPVATKTRLGWCIFGKNSDSGTTMEQLNLHLADESRV